MRNSTVPTMLRALEWNLKRNQPSVRLAEFGRVYEKSERGYREPRTLTLGACGLVRPLSWRESPQSIGFFDLKADVAALLQPFATTQVNFEANGLPAYYRSGYAATARAGDEVVAYFGELDPEIARTRKMRQPVLVAELFLDPLYADGLRIPGHQALPRVPAVSRDFSLLVPDDVPFARIRTAVGQMQDLVTLQPVEVFRGQNVPPGCYGLLLRASWQRLETSFTDQEVNAFADQLRSALEALGIRQRT